MTRWQKKLLRFLMKATLTMLSVCLVALLTSGILHLTDPERLAQSDSDMPNGTDPNEAENNGDTPTEPQHPSADQPTVAHPRMLGQTADAGQAYIDSMVFVGESTTAHLRSRGVLTGGKSTQQVWADDSNTMSLDLNILQKVIRYPATGQEMTIPAAAALAKPRYMVLSFGVNGIRSFASNEQLYRLSYGKLIEAIHAASPDTVVILQTVYPLAQNQTTFGEGAVAINAIIDRLNDELLTIAAEYDAHVVDTASVLYDNAGLLRNDYQSGDGLHLSTTAYLEILRYLRTHAYTAQ